MKISKKLFNESRNYEPRFLPILFSGSANVIGYHLFVQVSDFNRLFSELTLQNSEQIDFSARALEKSDAELLLQCRAGDETAWATLVKRFERLVAAVPRRAGLSEDLTAEVFQETFVTLIEKINQIEQPERLRAWLVTTAKFKTWRLVAREKIGRKTILETDDAESAVFEIPDDAPLADARLVELEQQHLVRAAVSALDERCREMLTMLYLTEPAATYVEVARAVGVSETSISPLRARCLKKMVKLLK